MTKLHTLLTSTALVAFAALPSHALTLDSSTKLGLYTAGMVPTMDVDDSTGATAGDNAASGPSGAAAGSDTEAVADVDDSTGAATGDNVASAPSGASADGTATAAVDVDDSTGPATGDNVASAPAPEPAKDLGAVLIADSGFNADEVVDSTGTKIGVVESVIKQEDNNNTLIVLVNGGMADESRFTLGIDPMAESDGEVKLSWTVAELTAALAAL